MAKGVHSLKGVRRKRLIFMVLMLAWPVFHLLLEWYLNGHMIVMSFLDYTHNLIHGEFVGFDNFRGVISMFTAKNEFREVNAVKNCLELFVLIVFVNAPIALAFAYLLYLQVPAHKILRYVLYIPCITSAVVLVLAFRGIVQPGGPLHYFYNFFGLEWPNEGFIGLTSAWRSIIIFSIWTGVETNIIYFLSCMRRVPVDYIEAAKLDGASEPRIFFSIILPLISPTVCTMLSLGVSTIFSWALPSLLMLAPADPAIYGSGTMGLTILNFTTGNKYGIASAYGILLTLIATPMMLSVRWLSRRLERNVEY